MKEYFYCTITFEGFQVILAGYRNSNCNLQVRYDIMKLALFLLTHNERE